GQLIRHPLLRRIRQGLGEGIVRAEIQTSGPLTYLSLKRVVTGRSLLRVRLNRAPSRIRPRQSTDQIRRVESARSARGARGVEKSGDRAGFAVVGGGSPDGQRGDSVQVDRSLRPL